VGGPSIKHYLPGNRRGWTTNQLRTQCAVDGGIVHLGYVRMEGRYHPMLNFRGYILRCREWSDSPQRARRLGRDIAIEIFGKEK
jgi:hypothetical protein